MERINLRVLLFLATLCLSPITFAKKPAEPAFAPGSRLIVDGSELTFHATGKPSLLKIKGQCNKLNGKVDRDGNQASAEFKIPTACLETGLDLRNKHLKEKYLAATTYPEAILKIAKIELPEGFDYKTSVVKEQKFDGTLLLHGEEKPVSGDFSFNGPESVMTAKMKLKISDFKIETPTYMGVTVSDEIDVEMNSKKILIK